jgi:hypothetical protein
MFVADSVYADPVIFVRVLAETGPETWCRKVRTTLTCYTKNGSCPATSHMAFQAIFCIGLLRLGRDSGSRTGSAVAVLSQSGGGSIRGDGVADVIRPGLHLVEWLESAQGDRRNTTVRRVRTQGGVERPPRTHGTGVPWGRSGSKRAGQAPGEGLRSGEM